MIISLTREHHIKLTLGMNQILKMRGRRDKIALCDHKGMYWYFYSRIKRKKKKQAGTNSWLHPHRFKKSLATRLSSIFYN
jgi:hypothetical protein